MSCRPLRCIVGLSAIRRAMLGLGLLLASSLPAWAGDGACALNEGRWGGGPPMDVERWSGGGEDLLLVSAGAELVLFDIQTPAAPVELGRVPVGHPVNSIAVSTDGQLAAVSDWFEHVTLVDIGNRAAPSLRGQYAWPGLEQPTGLAFKGNRLYVAVRTVGLVVLNIADPDAPTFVAASNGAVSDFVFDVALRGNYAYLGQDTDGVQIVNIGNPANPTVVGSVPALTGAGQIDIVGNRAYVARGSAGFSILDLAIPTAPTVLGGFDDTGFGFGYETALLSGNRLALAAGSSGTVIYDIATPAAPVQLAAFEPYSNPYRLLAVGNLLFMTARDVPTGVTQVKVVEFPAAAPATVRARIDFDWRSEAVSVGPGHVLAANGPRGVVMLDSLDPAQPAVAGRLPLGYVEKVGHVGGYGVVGHDGSISVIDPQPSGPALVSTFANGGHPIGDLIGDGDRLYVASGDTGGLRIFDLTNPAAPQLEGAYVAPGEWIWQIAVADGFAYSGYIHDQTIRVIDVSDPAAPVVAGSHLLPGGLYPGATDIAARGDVVFVVTQLNGVRILQNDGGGDLDEIADIEVFPAVATGVAVDGERLYISAGVFSGLLVYDVSDPANPQFVEQHNTTGEALGVAAAHGTIALAEGGSGVSTFGCDAGSGNQPPVAIGSISSQNDEEGETIFPLSTHSNFNDPDGQALSYTATGLPSGLNIGAGSGTIQGTLPIGSAGTYSVTVKATDPFGLFATQSFTWHIIATDPLLFRDGFESPSP